MLVAVNRFDKLGSMFGIASMTMIIVIVVGRVVVVGGNCQSRGRERTVKAVSRARARAKQRGAP